MGGCSRYRFAFNAIIERPTLQALGAITSEAYLARTCYADYLKASIDKQAHKVMMISTDLDLSLLSRGASGPGDDVEEVIPYPDQPEKKLRVGKHLESNTKIDITFMLSNNLDLCMVSR